MSRVYIALRRSTTANGTRTSGSSQPGTQSLPTQDSASHSDAGPTLGTIPPGSDCQRVQSGTDPKPCVPTAQCPSLGTPLTPYNITHLEAIIARQRERERVGHATQPVVPRSLGTQETESECPDVEDVSVGVSLRDPLSLTRMEIPVRSILCTHQRCVDYTTYISFQTQPEDRWVCPMCSKKTPCHTMRVDAYTEYLLSLKETQGVDCVTVDAVTGVPEWPVETEGERESKMGKHPAEGTDAGGIGRAAKRVCCDKDSEGGGGDEGYTGNEGSSVGEASSDWFSSEGEGEGDDVLSGISVRGGVRGGGVYDGGEGIHPVRIPMQEVEVVDISETTWSFGGSSDGGYEGERASPPVAQPSATDGTDTIDTIDITDSETIPPRQTGCDVSPSSVSYSSTLIDSAGISEERVELLRSILSDLAQKGVVGTDTPSIMSVSLSKEVQKEAISRGEEGFSQY
ncbi:E3 SUMO protein ligase [Kipferlia bialata]|uniref:E3 SUMO protein ligase n=1 Tax=Kipferlia bialata TaxID=797122 RepID=A0A9K3GHF7_9EUKA|nr:E3 SUMO protein ligase [Kipferlia bialata]|eukprot:g5525.t1